jgi:hypothetical protein
VAVNDTSRNGRSPRRAELEERRLWVWESSLRGLVLASHLNNDDNVRAAGLRVWSNKEKEQRGTFRYDHIGERLEYRRPVVVLERFAGQRELLRQAREAGEPPSAEVAAVGPKEHDDSLMRGICRLELASRFPWRTRELFGWDDRQMLEDAAERNFDAAAADFSSVERIQATIAEPLGRMLPAEGRPPEPESPKSAYWLRLIRDQARNENPPLEHLAFMKDTADFGANHFLRVLYLFGPLPALLPARSQRRAVDKARFTREILKEWIGDRQVSESEHAQLLQRAEAYRKRLTDPFMADLRFSSAVAGAIKQALLRFKYWLDEPFLCKDVGKLHAARKSRQIPEQEEMVFWSENHYVLFATAEYLAGQLWPDELFVPGKDFQDPAKPNGAMLGRDRMRRAKARLLKWLNHRIMLGWSEWYAPGYMTEHAEALYNLVDFCADEEIATKANIALDLLAFDAARLSHRGSFGVTGGRAQSKFKVCAWAQSPGDWFEFLFGMRGAFAYDATGLAVIAAGSSYEIPDVLLEIGTAVPETPLIDMSRVSIHFNEKQRYGIDVREAPGWAAQAQRINHRLTTSHDSGYNQADDDTVLWWTRSAYFNKQIVNSTVRLLEKYGLEHTAPFTGYAELFGGGMNVGEDLAAIGGAVLGSGILGAAGPGGAILGAGLGAFGMSALMGKGVMRPAITSGRIAGSAAAMMAFGPMGLLLSIPLLGWPFGDDEDLADDLSLFIEGSSLTRANLYTWRDRGAMLSSAQNFRPTQLNFQSNFCQATLTTEATAWTTSPYSGSAAFAAEHVDGPGWWTGYWSAPRVVQFENAAIMAYRPEGMQSKLHTNCSHCWLPRAAFVEFVEGVRPANVDGDDDGSWAFGKVVHPDGVEGYIGVYSARDADYQDQNSDFYKEWWDTEVKEKMDELGTTEGDRRTMNRAAAEFLRLGALWGGGFVTDFFADKDLYGEDDNLWIIQVGSSDEFGSFKQFKEEVTAARINIDFGDMQCSYDIPRRRRLELHTDIDEDDAREEGRFRYHGRRLDTDLYPRYSSPFVRAGRVEWGQTSWALQWNGCNAFYSMSDPAAPSRALNAPPPGAEGRQIRAIALRIRTEHESMEEDSVARATVRAGGSVVVPLQEVAHGEVDEHTNHDVEWLSFAPVDGAQPFTIEIWHGPANASGDADPHWRMRFEAWVLTNDSRLLPCSVDLAKAKNYDTQEVRHLNFEDEHRTSGEVPLAFEL